MNNNDILRRIRYTFDYNDNKMMAIFASSGLEATRDQVCGWLKKDEDAAFINCTDSELAHFLNGLINEKRGKRDGGQPPIESRLTNNTILRKLRIALDLKEDGMLEMMALADFRMSKPELSAFFRKPEHKHYRECKDQILRNFLKGVQLKYRPTTS